MGKIFLLRKALFVLLLFTTVNSRAQLVIRQFVLFGNQGVTLGSSTTVAGGRIGGETVVSNGTSLFTGDGLHARSSISLTNSNTVRANITAGTPTSTGNTLQFGSNASIAGNIDVYGNASVKSGSVSGTVTISGKYSGPSPTSLFQNATPQVPSIPTGFPVYDLPGGTGTMTVNQTRVIAPGVYAAMTLNGNQTITFDGPGDYVFDRITNSGNFNKFLFNFKGETNKIFRIFVKGDVALYKILIDQLNLTINNAPASQTDLASRIFMQAMGDGTSQGGDAWSITSGSSGNNQSTWLGTVEAPNGNITIGSGSSSSKIIGSLWSGKKVGVNSGVTVTYAKLLCTEPEPIANAGSGGYFECPNPVSITLGTSASSGSTYNWTTVRNCVTVSVGSTKTVTVDMAGLYTLTVTNACGDQAISTALVGYKSCFTPLNNNPCGKEVDLIGSELRYLSTNIDEAFKYLTISPDKKDVLIEAVAKIGFEASARQKMMAKGLHDTIPNGLNPQLITGYFAIANLLSLNDPDLATVINHIRPVYTPVGNIGLTTSAGDISINAHLARNGFNVHGENIKIGVISDSYNTLGGAANDIIQGDLPGTGNLSGNTTPVSPVVDFPAIYGVKTDEGRAMMQIAHDLAPKSQLAFRTGFISAGDMALGVIQLQQAGCNVIVDDVTYVTEPFFKDGIVSKAVDSVKRLGVTYVTSAGNFGQKSYTATFTPIWLPEGVTVHNFGDDNWRQRLQLSKGQYTIVLQWQDEIYSLGTAIGTQNDMDIYLNTPGGRVGFNRNNIGGDPLEILSFSTEEASVTAELMIVRAGFTPGTPAPRFKYIIFRGNAEILDGYSSLLQEDKSTIVGHANSPSAITVGAALWSNSPSFGREASIASFSSTGGTPVFTGSVTRSLIKPDLVGPNGVNTTVDMGPDNDGRAVYGDNSDPRDGFSNFYGTSAAAPHVAAAAALVQSAHKKFYSGAALSTDQLRTLLFTTALPMHTPPLPNLIAGWGLVQPDAAIRTFANPTPQIVSMTYDDSDGQAGEVQIQVQVSGNYLTDNSVIVVGTQTITTSVNVESGTLSGTVPPFTGNPPVYVYTPPMANGDGGTSNFLYFYGQRKSDIRISVDNKTKLYGQPLPANTFTVTVDNMSLAAYNQKYGLSLTLSDIGLGTGKLQFSYIGDVGAMTDVGAYGITATRTFDLQLPADNLLLFKYNYQVVSGTLFINKLPVTITPGSMTVTYGDAITNIVYNYTFDNSIIGGNATAVTSVLNQSYAATNVSNVLGVVNGLEVGYVNYLGGNYPMVINPSVVIGGKLYPVLSAADKTSAFVIYNGQTLTVQVNAERQTAFVIYNGTEIPVVNGGMGATLLLNGQIYPVLYNSLTGAPYIQFNQMELPVQNGADKTSAFVIFNTADAGTVSVTISNGADRTGAFVIYNGEYYAVFNGADKTSAFVIFNSGEFYANAVINALADKTSAFVIFNGGPLPVVNGADKTSAFVIFNNEPVPVVNGATRETAFVIYNGGIKFANAVDKTSAFVIFNGESTQYAYQNSLSASALANLSFSASANTISNARMVNASAMMNVVDLSSQLFTNAAALPNATRIVNTLANVSGRGILNANAIINGTAQINYLANTIPVTNSGSGGLVNGETFSGTTSRNAVIIDQQDAISNSSGGALITLQGINVITGLGVGKQVLIPATLINKNFNVTYGTATVTIAPAQITVQASNATKTYGDIKQFNPVAFKLAGGSMKYGEQLALVQLSSAGAVATATTGHYPIIPALAIGSFGTDAGNYSITYINGDLNVVAKTITVTADAKSKTYGGANPPLTYTTNGLLPGDVLTGALTRTAGENAGTYSITIGSLSGSPKYIINFIGANFTINKAIVTVSADNKTKAYGAALPALTWSPTSVSGLTLTTTATAASPPGKYPITAVLPLPTLPNQEIVFVPGVLTIGETNCTLLTHSKFTSFGSTTKDPTSLWLNIEIKVSGQLKEKGDYILYTSGNVTFTNITCNPDVANTPIKNGIIVADNVSVPVTRFDRLRDMFITRVPIGYSSTSDIFIAGGILTSTNGFTKKNNAYSTVQGRFYTNKTFSAQWNYAMAAYQKPDKSFVTYADLEPEGNIWAYNGTLKAGSPEIWKDYVVSGGSGNGGSNLTGSSSSQDNFQACELTGSNYNNQRRYQPQATTPANEWIVNVYPNPASSYTLLSVIPGQTGKSAITLFDVSGRKVADVYQGQLLDGTEYKQQVATGHLPPGVYYLQIIQNEAITTRKLVINR